MPTHTRSTLVGEASARIADIRTGWALILVGTGMSIGMTALSWRVEKAKLEASFATQSVCESYATTARRFPLSTRSSPRPEQLECFAPTRGRRLSRALSPVRTRPRLQNRVGGSAAPPREVLGGGRHRLGARSERAVAVRAHARAAGDRQVIPRRACALHASSRRADSAPAPRDFQTPD
jgi:hypothetical protein